MAIKSGIFNSVNGDRRYKAEDFAQYFATFIANGVFPNPSTGFQVIVNDNMAVSLRPGQAWINGYFVVNDIDYSLTLDAADGVLSRIDRIVLQLNYLNREIIPVVKKGTFASTPVAPTLKRDADAYEIALADVYVGKGVLSITQANITDLRLNTELCGIVHGVVDQVDTTTLFNQYQTWLAEKKSQYDTDLAQWTVNKQSEYQNWYNTTTTTEQQEIDDMQAQFQSDWDVWFASVQDALNGDTAGNLFTLIEQKVPIGCTWGDLKGASL